MASNHDNAPPVGEASARMKPALKGLAQDKQKMAQIHAHSAASSAQFGEFSGAQKLLNQSDSTEENEGDAKTETSASALQLTCLNCAVDGTVATPKPLWSPGELGRHLMTDFHTSAEYLSRVTNHTEDEEKVPCLSCNRHILTANFLKHIESQHSGHR